MDKGGQDEGMVSATVADMTVAHARDFLVRQGYRVIPPSGAPALFGCHFRLAPDGRPQGCVLEGGAGCVQAGAVACKELCRWWARITPDSLARARSGEAPGGQGAAFALRS